MTSPTRKSEIYQATRLSTRLLIFALLASCLGLWHQRNVAREEKLQTRSVLDSIIVKAEVPILALGDSSSWPSSISLLKSVYNDTPLVGLRTLKWLTGNQSPYANQTLDGLMSSVRTVGRYGARRGPNRSHKGIDLPGPLGAPVMPIRPGVVIYAGSFEDSVNFPGRVVDYGQTVKVLDPVGIEWWYSHLEQPLDVTVGNVVVAGHTTIGRIGMTGNISQVRGNPTYGYPHCHVTLYDTTSKQIIDPRSWIRGGPNWGRLAKAIRSIRRRSKRTD